LKKSDFGPLANIRHESGADAVQFTVKGRDRWALECLMAAGARGCTPIDNPGPRWSGYMFNLRHLGLDIETITEPHGGAFAGHHGRYVLRSHVTRVDPAALRGVA
jgi:hypothetical protein